MEDSTLPTSQAPSQDSMPTSQAPTKDESEVKMIVEAAEEAKVKEVLLLPIPSIPHIDKISKQFYIEGYNIEVTSLDITSHGCYAVVGCSNGMVLLFDMAYPSRTPEGGKLIGHIKAKGLHTNLLLTAKITEDCRFCFAGVMKGSSEMLAIDMGKLPVPFGETFDGNSTNPKSREYYDLEVNVYSHADAKLRGFGAAVRVVQSSNNGEKNEKSYYCADSSYRLACGRGIKNVHVWQFTPGKGGSSDDPLIRGSGCEGESFSVGATWTCIYDVATNGNTITSVGFRKHGMELISKSANVNVRMWDISGYAADPLAKPAHEDISNTQDVKCLLPEYALGGTYEFAIVKIDAVKEANRDAYEMPEKFNEEDSNGLRRRRTMREIDEVIATADGQHVLILCTDGGVMYFENNIVQGDRDRDRASLVGKIDSPLLHDNADAEAKKPTAGVKQYTGRGPYGSKGLIELSDVQREIGVDQVWAIKRVGKNGDVILIRAVKSESASLHSDNSEIHFSLLSIASRGEIKSTAIPADLVGTGSCSWHKEGYYNTAPSPRLPYSEVAYGGSEVDELNGGVGVPDCMVANAVPFAPPVSVSVSNGQVPVVTVVKKATTNARSRQKEAKEKEKDKENYMAFRFAPATAAKRKAVPSDNGYSNNNRTAKKSTTAQSTSLYITPAVGDANGTISPQENILRLVSDEAAAGKEAAATAASGGGKSMVVSATHPHTVEGGTQSPQHMGAEPSKLLFETATKPPLHSTRQRSSAKISAYASQAAVPPPPPSPVYNNSRDKVVVRSSSYSSVEYDTDTQPLRLLTVSPAPMVRKIVESRTVYAKSSAETAITKAFTLVNQLITHWMQNLQYETSNNTGIGVVTFNGMQLDEANGMNGALQGISVLQQLGIINLEQDRLKAQVVNEVIRTAKSQIGASIEAMVKKAEAREEEEKKGRMKGYMEEYQPVVLSSASTTDNTEINRTLSSFSAQYPVHTIQGAKTTTSAVMKPGIGGISGVFKSATEVGLAAPVCLSPIVTRFKEAADELVHRQTLDMRGAMSMDSIRNKSSLYGGHNYGPSSFDFPPTPRSRSKAAYLGKAGLGKESISTVAQLNPKVIFRHEYIFSQVTLLDQTLNQHRREMFP